MRHAKNIATLIFDCNELLYDIKNYCYIEGDLMDRQDEHANHHVYDVGENGNADRVTRTLDLAFSKCVELCYPYSKKELSTKTRHDDELEEKDEYVLRLKLPEGFSETTVKLLETLIHELLVYRAMEDWMSITKPESKENWREKAEEAEREIQSALNTRMGRVRRRLSVF